MDRPTPATVVVSLDATASSGHIAPGEPENGPPTVEISIPAVGGNIPEG